MSCVCPWSARWDETGRKERAIYEIGKKFTDYETRYTVLEKSGCAQPWASQSLRHYILNYTTMLIARMDPLQYLFSKPAWMGQQGGRCDSQSSVKARGSPKWVRKGAGNSRPPEDHPVRTMSLIFWVEKGDAFPGLSYSISGRRRRRLNSSGKCSSTVLKKKISQKVLRKDRLSNSGIFDLVDQIENSLLIWSFIWTSVRTFILHIPT